MYSLIPDSDAHDVEAAVQAAEAAFPIWSSMGIEGRAQILRKLSEGIETNMDAFVAAESKDNGKPALRTEGLLPAQQIMDIVAEVSA